RQLPERLSFADDGAELRSKLAGQLQSLSRCRCVPGCSVDHGHDAIRIRDLASGSELIENAQRLLGREPCRFGTLRGDEDFGAIEEAETAKVQIPDVLGGLECLLEVLVGFLPFLPVSPDAPEIVVCDRAPALVARGEEGLQRIVVMSQSGGRVA